MKLLCSIGLVLAAVIGLFILWLAERDPLSALPPPDLDPRMESESLPVQDGRHREHIILQSESLGDIGFILSLPDPLPQKKLPLLFILGGLGTGENNIRYVGEAGNNAIIGYDWPMPVRFYSGMSFLTQMPDLYRRLMTIPGQMTTVMLWLAKQNWADKEHVSLLGFSLGALAAPSIQDLAASHYQPIGWTILAYGGAPLSALFINNPHIKPDWMRYALAPLIDILLHPLEPTQHLTHIIGHFLVLQGSDDLLIPARARLDLVNAVPEPKTIITFEGDHMGVGENKMQLLQKIIDASKHWLSDSGAVDLH